MECQGVNVTSLVQTVIDCLVRLELPEAVAIVDAVMGSRRAKGEGLTRIELQEASSLLASAAKHRRVLEVLALADEKSESVGESRSRTLGYKVVRWDWKAATNPELLRRKLAAAGITAQKSPPRGPILPELPGESTT